MFPLKLLGVIKVAPTLLHYRVGVSDGSLCQQLSWLSPQSLVTMYYLTIVVRITVQPDYCCRWWFLYVVYIWAFHSSY